MNDVILIDTKAVVLALQKVYKERKLSIDKALEIVKSHDPSSAVSRTTIARVFRKGAEKEKFRWEASLRPIANALLNIEDVEVNDEPDTQAYKTILKLKKDMIEDLEEKVEDYEEMKVQNQHYRQTIELLSRQVELKDERIDKLLATNERQATINERITERLLSCPCPHKEGCK